MVKKKLPGRNALQEVFNLVDAFCRDHLNDEYVVLCRTLAEKLARKRPSPMLRGEPKTWACAIIRVIGWVNFLDDRSQKPHLKLTRIDKSFGVAESTAQGKVKAIRQLLKIRQFHHEWTLPSRWDSTVPIWTLHDQNGFMVDIRKQSAESQRAAFRQGLIPYVPADRAAEAMKPHLETKKSGLLYQFKIVLKWTEPPVWRRIQVLDESLDKLHEHIQAAMGWQNSHLHHFLFNGRRYGDPELIGEGGDTSDVVNSTQTLISAIVPSDGRPFLFLYEYDFGDSWLHELQFEGNPSPHAGITYPHCLEGDRACPPEDVGGPPGFADYLAAVSNPDHERHDECVEWHGKFSPSKFNPQYATHLMQEGLPDWRKMQ